VVTVLSRAATGSAIQEKACTDFFWFAYNLVYGDLEPNLLCDRDDGPHVQICRFYERTEKGLGEDPRTSTLTLVPRGFFKTSLCVVAYPLWVWARNPNYRILLLSAGADLAAKTMGQIKEHCEHNDNLLRVFPHLAPKNKNKRGGWSVSKMQIAGFQGLSGKEASAESKGLGSKLAGNHYHRICVDDVVCEDNVQTEVQIRKTIEYFDRLRPVLTHSGVDSQNRVTGTIWHALDLYGYMKLQNERAIKEGREPPHKILEFPIWDEEKEDDCIWEEIYSSEVCREMRSSMEPQTWANQYLLRVIATEDQIISMDDWHQMQVEMPEGHTAWPVYASVDPSSGRGRDCTCIATWTVAPNGLPYLLDIYNDRVEPDQVMTELYARHEKYRYRRIWFEAQTDSSVWEDIFRRELVQRGMLPIVTVRRNPHKEAKESRIRALGRFMRRGYLRIGKRAAGLSHLKGQAFTWPRTPRDDVLDALSEVVVRTAPPKRQRMEDTEKRYPPEIERLLRGGRGASPHYPRRCG